MVTKTAWCWHSNRHVGQWNRIEDTETNLYNYSHLILDKEVKNIHKEKIASLIKGAGEIEYPLGVD